MEKDTGRKIKILQSNNRGVYTSDLFLQLCQNEEIERNHSSKNTTIELGGSEDELYLSRKSLVFVI